MPVENVLPLLKKLERSGEITGWIRLESREAVNVDFPETLSPRICEVLQARGVGQLYSHQADAFRAAERGENLVVVTPTASGKTLCYNLPILNALLKDPEARALYLFPTKALAQDQMAELLDLEERLGIRFGVHTYDGDTPGDVRRKIRQDARIVLTNPDMLHSGILPHHPKWVEFLQNLRFVVVDELHTYRGIFGSHVANVFRRLKRVVEFYRGSVQFLCASATIANPDELAQRLLEAPVRKLDQSGAPRGAKDLIFYNPPIINQELGLRRSALGAARRIAEAFLREDIQTIVFATSRVNVEVLLRYLQESIETPPGLTPRIRGYRGGYLPQTRREIERQLREKEILGVVCTNALELGIDIGTLEACVLTGYPGSVASTWQQVGRAGRRSGQSVAVVVARNLPLDQFIVQSPQYFLDQSPEHGLIHPDNLQILVSHIKCAAFELPFQKGERFGGESLDEILGFLAGQGLLARQGSAWHWTDESYPADSVSLRAIAEENFVVTDVSDGNSSIAEVDFDSAPELIHEDAIYLCEGRQYQVERLDYDARKAFVRPVSVDYYTEAISYSGLRVLGSEGQKTAASAEVEHGEVHLARKFPGFKKIRFRSGENLGYGKIELPIHEMHTTSYWLTVPETRLDDLAFSRSQVIQAFLGAAYALHHIATVVLMCDFHDLGRSVGDRSTRWFAVQGFEGLGCYSAADEGVALDPDQMIRFDPTIFLYDNRAGGVGLSEKLFDLHDHLIEQAHRLVARCSCLRGCPSCVGPVTDPSASVKGQSLRILGRLSSSELVMVQ